MFGNIGGKIKGLAKVLFWIEAIAAVIVGFVLVESTEGLSLLFAIAGVLVVWISAWFLYGFGELIDRVSEIAKNTRILPNTPTDTNNQEHHDHIENSEKIATTFKSSGIMDIPKRNR